MENEETIRFRSVSSQPVPNLASAIVDEIVGMIGAGRLKPGDRLPAIEDLCQQLCVGRTSVREALKALDVIGLIEIRHGRGTFVGENPTRFFLKPIAWQCLLNRERTSALAETRRCCEGELAALAAERALPQDVLEIHRALDRQAGLLDSDEFTDAALEFHIAVWRAAHNELMLHILHCIRHLQRQSISEVISRPATKELTLVQHRAIGQAITDRSPELARRAMRDHLEYVETAMLGLSSDGYSRQISGK